MLTYCNKRINFRKKEIGNDFLPLVWISVGNVSDGWLCVPRFNSTFLDSQCRPFKDAADRETLYSSRAPTSPCLNLSPCRLSSAWRCSMHVQPACCTTTHLDSQWAHFWSVATQPWFSLLSKLVFGLMSPPPQYMNFHRGCFFAQCFACWTHPPSTLPHFALLFMRFTVLSLMLMLVNVWFQHIFFVPRLTS